MSKFKFEIQELVCPHIHAGYNEKTQWMFVDMRLLETLNVVREQIVKTSMTINNYKIGGSFSQRGVRCNCCQIVKDKKKVYMSAHVTGKGVDFDVKGMTAEQVRQAIIKNKHLLPYPIRLEKGVSWVHLDVYDNGSGEKVSLF